MLEFCIMAGMIFHGQLQNISLSMVVRITMTITITLEAKAKVILPPSSLTVTIYMVPTRYITIILMFSRSFFLVLHIAI